MRRRVVATIASCVIAILISPVLLDAVTNYDGPCWASANRQVRRSVPMQ